LRFEGSSGGSLTVDPTFDADKEQASSALIRVDNSTSFEQAYVPQAVYGKHALNRSNSPAMPVQQGE
jgi:hypothetical protein